MGTGCNPNALNPDPFALKLQSPLSMFEVLLMGVITGEEITAEGSPTMPHVTTVPWSPKTFAPKWWLE